VKLVFSTLGAAASATGAAAAGAAAATGATSGRLKRLYGFVFRQSSSQYTRNQQTFSKVANCEASKTVKPPIWSASEEILGDAAAAPAALEAGSLA
jgi:hypothetical protein